MHAIVLDIDPEGRGLAKGSIVAGGVEGDVGRNSFLREGWLPPDPPHGEHDYVIQLFALSQGPDAGESPGRVAFVEAIADKVLAAGILIGTYSLHEPVDPGLTVPDPVPGAA